MQVRSRRSGWVYTTALTWRGLIQRFSFAFLLSFSVAILFVGHSRPELIQHFRIRVIDSVAPIFVVVSKPLEFAHSVSGRVASYRALLEENEKLRVQNALLTRWQNAALTLKHENKELRSLLNYQAEPSLSYVSARVIANTGGAFVHSLIVTAGSTNGVHDGMAATTGDGLVGRVVELGEWTSRLLLITDMTSRIPVKVLGTGEHAVLAGDNSPHPTMLYLPEEFAVQVGARVVTSGHGGIFPPNIPVGIVTEIEGHTVKVTPMAKLGQINQIRLIDFNLAGGSVNPMAAKLPQ